MTRYLFIGLTVLLVVVVRIGAQFSITQQPMFSNATVGQDFATNLAHRWVSTDLTNDIRMSNWVDRITGTHTWGSYASHNITNTTNGIYFTPAGSALTNLNGRDVKFFSMGASDFNTNWAVGVMIKWDQHPSATARRWWGYALNQGFTYDPQGSGNPNTALLVVPSPTTIWKDPATVNTNVWYDIVYSATNNTDGTTAYFGVWFDGVLTTNTGAATAAAIPNTFGLHDYTAGGETTDAFGMRGWVREIWVRTNLLSGQGLDGFARDLHYARTNLYGN